MDDVIKPSEDGKPVIVWLVERQNCHTNTTIIFDRHVLEAWSCDLMENVEAWLSLMGHTLPITLKPYEILTIRLVFNASM